MSSEVIDGVCQGISRQVFQFNPDISVLLVRFSPKDAPSAYWSMTSTAFSLIISSIVTSAQNEITLLDAIVVVYVLLLPVLASAFGLSEIMAPQSTKNSTRSVHSPLLIVANWTRSAFTYSFALYVWISAPTFGQGPPECNKATFFIFFGASLPALGSGRYLNLAVWSILTLTFVWRSLKGARTIFISLHALFSKTASQALLRPKHSAENEVHREVVRRKNFVTGETTQTNRLFRPRQIFHELLQGMASHILGWAPSGTGRWYRLFGKAILITFLSIWAIVMTELQLALNDQGAINNEWGFGQILPLVLTISPLFSLWESFLSRHSSGPTSKSRKIRFSIRKASNLQRPQCELDFYPPEFVDKMPEAEVDKARAPSAFAVITIDEREMYTTYEAHNTTDPEWEESFDVEVDDLSTVVIRVFDRKCIDRGWTSFIGFTTIHPFTAFPHAVDPAVYSGEEENPAPPSKKVDLDDIPLVRDGHTVPNMTIGISLSSDTKAPISLLVAPPILHGPKIERVERRVNLVKFGNRKMGSKKETTTRVYEMS
ncbi:hypothetical protein CVT25_002600 [Psilocybe cyanescens]|uniref:C2 domain-containing protein n=1 Tax=Psilocybe cyanescens TaxID=93625 RepID=A0A409XWD5_PSICY|nr:hypothetical protein CVT25_002600 [Psilocybe cyanescens]